MDDMNAFEHQLARDAQRDAGPPRSVDPAAVFAKAVTATQSSKWRFGSMFTATKFVVAAAIVALFGGFLVAGVLTGPSEESVPGVGASPSVQAEPTAASAPPATIRTDLLPGVELTVEQIAPSVFRVLDDGAGHELDPIWQVASTPEGGAWTLAADRESAFSPRVYRLGEPGAFTTADGIPELADGLRVGADGRLYAHASGGDEEWVVLDDGEWVDATERETFTYRLSPDDGTSWEIANIRPVELGIVRHDRSGTSEYRLDDMHLDGLEGYDNYMSEAIDPKALALAPDGRVWSLWSARERNGAPPGLGLAEFDGTSWRDITPDQWRIGSPEARKEGGRPGSILDATLSVAPDGTLQVAADVDDPTIPGLDETGWIPARRVEASWDGDRWTIESRTSWDLASIAAKIGGFGVPSPGVVGPDGTMLLHTARSPWSPDLYVVQPEPAAVGDEDVLTVDATTPDLLPGVDLVTEEVEPGVYRVLSDGTDNDFDVPLHGVYFGPGGHALVLTEVDPVTSDGRRLEDGRRLIRLGKDGASDVFTVDPFDPDVAVAADGTAWAVLAREGYLGLWSYDGEALASHADPDGSSRASGVEVTPDGSVWATRDVTDHQGPWVARIHDGEWTVLPPIDDPGMLSDYPGRPGSFAVSSDGTVWYANGNLGYGPALAFGGLLRFDGESWTAVAPASDRPDLRAGPLAVGSDGTLWVYLDDEASDTRLARLDGGGWTVFGPDDGVPVLVSGWLYRARPAVDAAGRLWIAFRGDGALPTTLGPGQEGCAGLLSFDGTEWTRYLEGVCADRVAVAPGGSIWVTATEHFRQPGAPGPGLYVITPEATAATE